MKKVVTIEDIKNKKNQIHQWTEKQDSLVKAIELELGALSFTPENMKQSYKTFQVISDRVLKLANESKAQVVTKKGEFTSFIKQAVLQISESKDEEVQKKYTDLNEAYFTEVDNIKVKFAEQTEKADLIRRQLAEKEDFAKVKIQELKASIDTANAKIVNDQIKEIGAGYDEYKVNVIEPKLAAIQKKMNDLDERLEKKENDLIQKTYSIAENNAKDLGNMTKQFIDFEREVVFGLIHLKDKMEDLQYSAQELGFKLQVALRKSEFNLKEVNAGISTYLSNLLVNLSNSIQVFKGIDSVSSKIQEKTSKAGRDKILKLQANIMKSSKATKAKLLGIVDKTNNVISAEKED